MPVALAALAAVLFGTSDLLVARAGRRVSSLAVTRTAVAVSALLAAIVAVVRSPLASVADLGLGFVSGVAMVGGLAVLHFGYSASRIGLVAPVSAVATAGIPVLVGTTKGDALSVLTVPGVALGLVVLVLMSLQPAVTRCDTQAFALGVGAGALFGVAFTLMGFVPADAGLGPVAAQRVAGLCLVTGIWVVRRDRYLVPAGLACRQAVVVGLLATAAVAALQFAFQTGPLAPVAVAGSQFVTAAGVDGR
jgi:hypothetical protein